MTSRTGRGLAPDGETAPNLTPPPGNPRFPLFDGLRAIAALSVFLGHTVTGTFSLSRHHNLFLLAVQLADQGVAIFFLISGFLLYRPFVAARFTGRPPRVGAFALRRAVRIVPAYWFALTLFIATGLVAGITSRNWWVFYAFGQNYRFSTIGQGIGVAWTLCIEVTFYAALPVFAVVAGRLAGGRRSVRSDCILLAVLAAASLAFRAHFHAFAYLAKVSTLPGTFTWFALGMMLACVSVAQGDRLRRFTIVALGEDHPTACWLVALGLLVIGDRLFRAPQTVSIQLAMHVVYGLVAFALLLPAVFGDARGGWARRLLRHPALVWLGLISYAFYLYHTIVIAEINRLVTAQQLPARYLVVLLLSALISCGCAAASYYLLERPLMELIRGRGRGGSPPAR